jgi:predicted MFS family arabinose efflux permease
MIADRFQGRDRSLAMGIYAAGALTGSLAALPLGGYLSEAYGWRGALWAVSIPGVVLALLMRITLRDRRGPAQATLRAAGTVPEPGESALKAYGAVLSQPVMRHLILGATLSSIAGAAGLSFGVSVLMRSHGISQATAGAALGFIGGAFSIVGTVGGGFIVSRLVRHNHRWRALVSMYAQVATIPFKIGFLTLASLPLAVVCSGFASLFSAAWMGPTFAALQDAAGPARRATAAACILVSYNLIGFGLGPLVAGLVSDALTPIYHEHALAMGLMVLQPFSLWGALHFYLASRHLTAPP